MVVPCGKSKETGVVNPRGYTLKHNGNLSYALFVYLSETSQL